MDNDQYTSIVRKLESIEQRLSYIEAGKTLNDEQKPGIPRRTIALIVVMTLMAAGMYFGINYVFDNLTSFIPESTTVRR
jgi:hypothetical protein